jgi:hypothetical protein
MADCRGGYISATQQLRVSIVLNVRVVHFGPLIDAADNRAVRPTGILLYRPLRWTIARRGGSSSSSKRTSSQSIRQPIARTLAPKSGCPGRVSRRNSAPGDRRLQRLPTAYGTLGPQGTPRDNGLAPNVIPFGATAKRGDPGGRRPEGPCGRVALADTGRRVLERLLPSRLIPARRAPTPPPCPARDQALRAVLPPRHDLLAL